MPRLIYLISLVLGICPSALSQLLPKLSHPPGHLGFVSSVTFGHNGELAFTSANGIKIWNANTGQLIHSIQGISYNPDTYERYIHLSPDDSFLVAANLNNEGLYLWDVETGTKLFTLLEDSILVSGNLIKFSSDGKFVAAAEGARYGSRSFVWEVSSGKKIWSRNLRTEIWDMSISKDNLLYLATEKGLEVISLTSGQSQTTILGQENYQSFRRVVLNSSSNTCATLNYSKQKKNISLLVWDLKTRKIKLEVETFSRNEPEPVPNLTYSLDQRYLTVTHTQTYLEDIRNPEPKIFDTKNGFQRKKLENWKTKYLPVSVDSAATTTFYNGIEGAGLLEVSPDGQLAFGTVGNTSVKIWNVATGKLLDSLQGHQQVVYSIKFSPDGRRVLTGSRDGTAKIWDLSTRKIKLELGSKFLSPYGQFTPDGKMIITSSTYGKVQIWDATTGLESARLKGGFREQYPIVSPNGLFIATISNNDTYKIWESNTGKLVQTINAKGNGTSNIFSWQWAQFQPNNSAIAILNYKHSSLEFYSILSGELQRTIEPPSNKYELRNFQFSEDGKFITTYFKATAEDGSVTTQVRILDIANGVSLGDFESSMIHYNQHFIEEHENGTVYVREHVNKYFNSSMFIADRAIWITKPWGKFFGPLTHADYYHVAPRGSMFAYDTGYDGDGIYFGSFGEKVLRIFATELKTSDSSWFWGWPHPIFTPEGDYAFFRNVRNRHDEREQLVCVNTKSGRIEKIIRHKGMLKDLNWPTKKIISQQNNLTLTSLETGLELLSWTLIDSANWVVTHPSGLFDASPGAMDKLYFVQGLDIIDFNQLKERYYEPGLWKKVMAGEELRNVVGMKSIDLPPDIQVGQVDEKGYLNINLTNRGGGIGEVNLFVNGKEVIKDARDVNVKPDAPSASLKIFVGKHKNIVKGQENFIAVKAWNKDHWVQSRGHVVSYHSKEIEQYKPAVHILTCGVSDYTGNEIDLKYAAKDANDVSVALQLGAKKLFGAERSYVYNLTTTQAKEFYPTKTNILKVLENISATAHPLDIFVMYLSGHGINYGGQDGDWHYLTQEAYTGSASAYNDQAIRAQTTISSNELVELFKKVPALKQVLMLDACASGKVVDNLMAQKDIESSTLRALDRMRDRTGMHIITGCTADAVSYEASKYGQGVLTYSLLEGIRGAALREDQYVDVNKLFQYAQDRVPQLAEGIGGIQSPQVFSPQGSQSFDIGLLSDVEKKEIPIAKIRPVYIRSNFQDENEMEDVLGLGIAVDGSLQEVSAKGIEAPIIFVDVKEYPDACKLIGRYKKENGQIYLKMRKKCGAEDKIYDLKAVNADGLRIEILKIL